MRLRLLSALPALALALAVLAAPGCGAKDPGLSGLAWTYESLTWLFQCPSDPLPVPASSARNLVVVDSNNGQRLSRERMVGTQVRVFGRVCPPPTAPRDIVFVLDVSGSMHDTDPVSNNSCGRLDALNTVFGKLPPSSNFGLVTFDDKMEKSSDKLYGGKDPLIANITGNDPTKFPAVACQAAGGTWYVTGLDRARTLLAGGRPDAAKTIAFLSDGEPDDGLLAAFLAAQLRTDGVTIGGKKLPITIATIMLGTGDDSVMKNDIASKIPKADDPGTLIPLSVRATDAGALPDLLDRMTGTKPATGFVSHGPDYAPLTQEVDFVPYLNGKDFQLPPFELTLDGRQHAYDLTFGYNFVQSPTPYTVHGALVWAD